MRITNALFLAIALLVSGCASGGGRFLGTEPNLQVFQGDALPPPSGSDLVATGRPALIGAYDRLQVTVFGVPELSLEEIQVDPAGRIAVPLVGQVEAGGKSTEEVSREIETRLRGRYVRNPQVAVNVRETRGHLITVSGQVTEPGIYPVTPHMTLQGAVARAKGMSEFARAQEVVVFRTVNGQRLAALYNLSAIQRGAYPDPPVYPNDVVMVGDSPGRRIFRDVLQAAPGILSPLIYILSSNSN